MGMSIERNSSESYTLEFEKIGSSEKISLSVYDDDRDLVLFANGSNVSDVEKALSFFSDAEPLFQPAPKLDNGDFAATFKNNPPRRAIVTALVATAAELQLMDYRVSRIKDGWEQ